MFPPKDLIFFIRFFLVPFKRAISFTEKIFPLSKKHNIYPGQFSASKHFITICFALPRSLVIHWTFWCFSLNLEGKIKYNLSESRVIFSISLIQIKLLGVNFKKFLCLPRYMCCVIDGRPWASHKRNKQDLGHFLPSAHSKPQRFSSSGQLLHEYYSLV